MGVKGNLSNYLLQALKSSLMPKEHLFNHFPVLSLQVFHFFSLVYHTVIRESTAIDALQCPVSSLHLLDGLSFMSVGCVTLQTNNSITTRKPGSLLGVMVLHVGCSHT